jgi:hypothetical protein
MTLQNYYEEAFKKYHNKGILVDTGPLLLLIIGSYDKDRIERFKYTQKYRAQDYDLLLNILSNFNKIVTTPSILTEVCNYLGYLPDEIKENVLLSRFCPFIDGMDEKYIESSILGKEFCFKKFGLTDSSIINNAKGNFIVLSDDFPLCGYLIKNNIEAINFNHLRSF